MAPESDLSKDVLERVRDVLAQAERAAHDVACEIEDAAVRHAVETRLAAEEQARSYMEESRLRAEAFAERRIERLQSLGSELEELAGEVLGELKRSSDTRRRLDALLAAVEDAKQQVREEAERPAPDLPPLRSESL
jgi:DNA anti-recombination protein RmuC